MPIYHYKWRFLAYDQRFLRDLNPAFPPGNVPDPSSDCERRNLRCIHALRYRALMQNWMETWSRRLWLGLAILSASYILMILWMRPWYGVADDGWLLRGCAASAEHGFFSAFRDYLVADYHWGMVRPLYFLYSQMAYCSTAGVPTAMYLINFLTTMFSVFLFGASVLPFLPKRVWSTQLFMAIFLLFTLSIYRFHDAFIIGAMQEKLVFLASALAFWSIKKVFGKSLWLSIAVILFFTVIGYSTKAQFILFAPALCLALLADTWQRKGLSFYAPLFTAVSALLLGALLLRYISAQGSYTDHYAFSNMPKNLLSRQGLELIAVGFLSVSLEVFFALRGNWSWPDFFRALLPSSMLLSFLLIMAPWSIGDSYIIMPSAPLAALCLCSLLQRVSIPRLNYVFALLLLTAFSMTFYRGYRGFGRWSDLRNVLFSEALSERVEKPHLAMISCIEGSDLMRLYLEKYRGLKLNKINGLELQKSTIAPTFAIADSALCALPADLAAKAKLISRPLFGGSFAIYDLP